MSNSYYCTTLQLFFFKKFFISEDVFIKNFFFKNTKVLTLKNKVSSYFFILPFVFDFVYKNNYFYLILNSNKSFIGYKNLFFFLVHLNQCLKQLRKVRSITFLIKGVGLKINLINNSYINLKLGYSHLISLVLPLNLTISIFKKKIILVSYNKVLLGNFGSIIYSYRPINVFTGKGLLKKRKKKFKLKSYIKKI